MSQEHAAEGAASESRGRYEIGSLRFARRHDACVAQLRTTHLPAGPMAHRPHHRGARVRAMLGEPADLATAGKPSRAVLTITLHISTVLGLRWVSMRWKAASMEWFARSAMGSRFWGR